MQCYLGKGRSALAEERARARFQDQVRWLLVVSVNLYRPLALAPRCVYTNIFLLLSYNRLRDKQLHMVGYLFELFYDLMIAPRNNVSCSPGFETCLGIFGGTD